MSQFTTAVDGQLCFAQDSLAKNSAENIQACECFGQNIHTPYAAVDRRLCQVFLLVSGQIMLRHDRGANFVSEPTFSRHVTHTGTAVPGAFVILFGSLLCVITVLVYDGRKFLQNRSSLVATG
jgi:hypothetical protein